MGKIAPSMTLRQLLPHYLEYREVVENKRGGTLVNDRAALNKLIEVAGDIQPRNLTTRHADAYVRAIGQNSTSHFNMRLSAIKMFVAWCRREKLVPRDFNLFDIRSRRVSRPDRHRVPVERFPELLDVAGQRHPRDRILVAIGLYLFLRGSEIRLLRLKDVDLEAGELHVYIKKTDDYDIMPISAELDEELRRWLRVYEERSGDLNPEWYLVPARATITWRQVNGQWVQDQHHAPLKPTVPMGQHIEDPVKAALADIGWQKTENPRLLREGMHTLRRSGARAYFDELVNGGYDGALKRVSAMLHHSSVTMTERYLGIREDRHSRNKAIKGRVMFPTAQVVDMQSVDTPTLRSA